MRCRRLRLGWLHVIAAAKPQRSVYTNRIFGALLHPVTAIKCHQIIIICFNIYDPKLSHCLSMSPNVSISESPSGTPMPGKVLSPPVGIATVRFNGFFLWISKPLAALQGKRFSQTSLLWNSFSEVIGLNRNGTDFFNINCQVALLL